MTARGGSYMYSGDPGDVYIATGSEWEVAPGFVKEGWLLTVTKVTSRHVYVLAGERNWKGSARITLKIPKDDRWGLAIKRVPIRE